MRPESISCVAALLTTGAFVPQARPWEPHASSQARHWMRERI